LHKETKSNGIKRHPEFDGKNPPIYNRRGWPVEAPCSRVAELDKKEQISGMEGRE